MSRDIANFVKRINVKNVWVDYIRIDGGGEYAKSEPVEAIGITDDGRLVGITKYHDKSDDFCERQQCRLRYYVKK